MILKQKGTRMGEDGEDLQRGGNEIWKRLSNFFKIHKR